VSDPILVTGSHRSGTTWVGRMLALDPNLVYVHEPFNPEAKTRSMRTPPPEWFQHVTAENEAAFFAPMREVIELRHPASSRRAGGGVLGRLRRRRALIKDPIAVMSAEWLADRFGTQNVILIRHPAAFASSLARLGWTFDFGHWVRQPLLLRDLLAPYEAEIRSYAEQPRDIVDQAILLWNAIHHVIAGYRARHPDWFFVRHEDLAEAPVEGFRALFDGLGLRWTPSVAATVRASSSDDRPGDVPVEERNVVVRDSRRARWAWASRLSPEDQTRVREGTAAVAAAFYDESDWSPTLPQPPES
jgi:hypothetical protein